MSPMLEKIARAMAWDGVKEQAPSGSADDLWESWMDQSQRQALLSMARAALLAMREPDNEAVFEAGRLSNDTSFRGLGRLMVTHAAMIDAILAGETE